METESVNIEQKESIKLMKMSKGYQWEIKLFPTGKLIDGEIDRLAELNQKLEEKYGNQII